METGKQHGSKRAGVELPGPPVARKVMMSIDKTKFQCPICIHVLKPPIFQCGAGHLACGACHGQLADKDRCYKQGCAQTGGYSRNLPLEDVLHTTKISCPFISFGCSSSVALYEMGEHEAKCPHRLCSCPKVGCFFQASLATVGEHLRDSHSWPARRFDYGEVFRLDLPESMRRFLLLAKEDGQVFVVFMDSVPVPVSVPRHVSLVCLRSDAVGTPHYTCKMSAEGIAAAATGKVSNVSVEMEVPSHAVSRPLSIVTEDAVSRLLVEPKMLHGPSRSCTL